MHVCVCLHVCACVCLWDVKTNCSVTQIWHKTNRIASHRIETSRVDSSRVDASWSHSIEIENRIHWVQLEQYIYIHIVYYCEFALLTRAINSQLRSVNLNSLLTLPCARMQSSIQSFSCHWHKKKKTQYAKGSKTHTNTHQYTHSHTYSATHALRAKAVQLVRLGLVCLVLLLLFPCRGYINFGQRTLGDIYWYYLEYKVYIFWIYIDKAVDLAMSSLPILELY